MTKLSKDWARRAGVVLLASTSTLQASASSGAQDSITDAASLDAVRAAVAEAEHEVRADGSGTWTAKNHANGFRAKFGAAGVALTSLDESKAWRLEIALESWGRAGDLCRAEVATPDTSAPWMEYRRGDLIEWYRNGTNGLEQGFTLLAPPARNDAAMGRALELRMRLAGDLRAELLGDGASLVLRDDCGELALIYAGLRAWDASGRSLEASLALEDGALSILVRDADAAYPITIDPLIATLEQKLLAATTHLVLGAAVDVDGDTAAAAAFDHDDVCDCDVIYVYVFVRSGGTWTEQQRLTSFGGSYLSDLALDGDHLAVSANAYTDDLAIVDVYTRSGTTWTHTLSLQTGTILTALGWRLAIEGDRFAVTDDTGGPALSRVYRYNHPGWTKEATFVAGGGVALRDDLLVLSTNPAPYYGPPCHIRVYQRTGTSWSVLTNAMTLGYGRYTVAIDEEHTIAVGDPDDDDAGTDAGAVYLLRRTGSTWTLWDKLLSPDFPTSAGFGRQLSFEDGTLAIGVAADDQAGTDAGVVYAYRRNGGWNLEPSLFAPDAASGDFFGGDAAVDGDTLIVGAGGDDDSGPTWGSAYVFRLSSEATVYCTAKVNSLGCLPEIDFVGTPSVSSANPFTISVRNVLSNKLGVFYYGLSGRGTTPFDGGIRCVSGNVKRTGMFLSGGNFPPTDCSGVNSINFNARIQSGIDPNLVAGVQVNGQFWTRDGGVASGTGLSDGIEFKIQP